MRNSQRVLGTRHSALGAAAMLALASAALGAQAPRAESRVPSAAAYAIRNATVVPVAGAPIPNGTVVIRNGRIEAVGANIQVPADAQVIDASGMYVYPGLIDSGTQLGLTEIGSVPGGQDTQEIGDFNPHNVAATAVNPHSELIPVTRVNGVTTVVTAAQGGIVSGQASLMNLVGWTPTEMAVKRQAAMVMTYPVMGGGGRRGGGGGFGGFGQQRSDAERREEFNRQVRLLRNYLADARAYADVRGRTANAAAGAPRMNLAMEAMIPVIRGQMPVVFDVNTADQIRGVLTLADSFGLKVILRGAHEAWRLADTLAMRRIPVIVGPTAESPDEADDPYDAIYANPGVLARAGVKIAFQTEEASNVRNLPYQAALATAYGLDSLEALRALTINAAEIWGVADQLGTIERGKVANLFVTTGNPLDVRSVPRHVFIRGQPVPMTDRHTRLYEQFRARPKGTQ